MIAGIAVGALIPWLCACRVFSLHHGQGYMVVGSGAVVVGVPMYFERAGMIPIVEALLGKGAALGTVLAFMMAVIALSLPEAIILRKVLTARLLAVYFGIVATGILLVGFLFNFLWT